MTSSVRIMTYNVRALKDDRAAVVKVIRAVDPDVLCLQEAPRHPLSGHRISALASDSGLLWPGGGGRGMMSTTLVTSLRLEVLASGHRRFPVRWRDEPRGWAYARVCLPRGAVFTAVSVHLGLRAEERPEHVRLLRDDPLLTGPVVIGGDINETAGCVGWERLADGLCDACDNAPTFPAALPRKRIDAIFSTRSLGAEAVPVDFSDALLAAASDHRPVVVDVHPGALHDDETKEPAC